MKSLKNWKIVLMLTAVFVLLAGFGGVVLQAQDGNAQLSGLVADNTGAMLPGASITATNTATNVTYTATADGAGSYLLPELLPGPYKLTVTAKGFGVQTQSGLILHTGDHLSRNFSLKPGAVEMTVVVSSAQALISSDQANSSDVLDNKMITELPQLNRNALDLTNTIPAIQGNGPQVDNLQNLAQNNAVYLIANSGNGYSLSGGQANSSNISVDGNPIQEAEFNATNRAVPTPDSVSEFRVETGVLTADVGRYGGGIISMRTQSGENTFHGRAFFYLRNQDTNANSWLYNNEGQPRQDYQQKNYGVAVGGPIRIPHVYNGKDKTFFFAAWEGQRFSSGEEDRTSVPSLLEREGNFSQTVIGMQSNSQPLYATIYDPFNGYEDYTSSDCTGPLASQFSSQGWCWVRPQFPNATIPAVPGGGLSGQSKLFAHYIAMWPSPNNAPIAPSNFVGNRIDHVQLATPIDKYFFRIDEALRQNHHIEASMSRSMITASVPPPFMHAGTSLTTDEDWLGVFLYTWAINPKTVFNFHLGVGVTDLVSLGVSNSGSLPDPNIDTSTWGFDPLITNNPAKLTDHIAPVATIGGFTGGYTNVGGDQYDSFLTQSDNGVLSVTRQLGRHTFKAGYEQYFIRFTEKGGDGTGVIGLGSGGGSNQYWNQNDGLSGDGLAELMLGSSNLNSWGSSWNPTPYGWNQGAYVMDDWKVNSKLTVQIGLRWDHDGPRRPRHSFGGLVYDLNAKNVLPAVSGFTWGQVQSAEGGILNSLPVPGWVTQGTTGLISLTNTPQYPSKNLYNTDIANFSPRLGLSWALNDKTVLHVSAGSVDQGLNGLSTDYQSFYYDTTSFGQISTQDGMHWISELCSCDHGLRSFPAVPGGNLGFTPPVNNNAAYYFDNWNTNANANGQGTTITHYDTPTSYMFGLGVQRQIGKDWVFTAEYQAIRGIHLLMHVNNEWSLNNIPLTYYQLGAHLNDQVPNPFVGEGLNFGSPTLPLSQLLGLSPQYGGTNQATPGQVSWGKSLSNYVNFQIQSRNYRGLELLVSYAIRKTLTDAGSSDINVQGLSGQLLQNPHNLMEGYGVAPGEMPQTLKVNYSYDLPVGRGRQYLSNPQGVSGHVLDSVVGGWAIAGISTWNPHGTPVLFPTENNGDGGVTVPGAALRWSYTNKNFRNSSVSYGKALVGSSGTFINSNGQGVLNPTSFVWTPDYTLANSPVYFSNLRNPGSFYTDMSILKKFYISDDKTKNFELRLEALNAFNHPIFGGIITDPYSPVFGGINGKNGTAPRVMQAGARFFF
jgi:hypothetical protein